MRRILRSIVITLGLAVLLFTIRWFIPESINRHFWGADGWFMADLVESTPFPLYYRSLLTLWIHKAVYILLSPWGASGWVAIAASSSLAGAVALQALWRINPDPAFMAINILCGSFLVFVGHVENYAWINAFLILSFESVLHWLRGNAKAWPAFTFLILAILSHMLALFYIPAYGYLLWKHRRFDPFEILIPVVAFSTLVAMLGLCFPMMGTDIGLERLVPIGHVWAKNQFFPLLSSPHLAMLLYFHWRAAFLGIPLEIPLLILLVRRIDTVYLRFMLACTFCGLFWTTIWHPDWGRLDWDLFGQFGISLHLLLGLVLRPKWRHFKDNEL